MNTFIPDASTLDIEWHKSSFSGSNSNCIEAGFLGAGHAVRDSKRVHGPALNFHSDAWSAFLAGVKAGAFSAATG